MASPSITDPKVVAGRKNWLAFASLYKDYLSKDHITDPTGLPMAHQIVLASIAHSLEPTEAGHRERKLIMERVDGKARDIQEHHISMADLLDSPFAKAMAVLTKPKTKQVMIEPGPDKEDPNAGALYAEVIDHD